MQEHAYVFTATDNDLAQIGYALEARAKEFQRRGGLQTALQISALKQTFTELAPAMLGVVHDNNTSFVVSNDPAACNIPVLPLDTYEEQGFCGYEPTTTMDRVRYEQRDCIDIEKVTQAVIAFRENRENKNRIELLSIMDTLTAQVGELPFNHLASEVNGAFTAAQTIINNVDTHVMH